MDKRDRVKTRENGRGIRGAGEELIGSLLGILAASWRKVGWEGRERRDGLMEGEGGREGNCSWSCLAEKGWNTIWTSKRGRGRKNKKEEVWNECDYFPNMPCHLKHDSKYGDFLVTGITDISVTEWWMKGFKRCSKFGNSSFWNGRMLSEDHTACRSYNANKWQWFPVINSSVMTAIDLRRRFIFKSHYFFEGKVFFFLFFFFIKAFPFTDLACFSI